MFNYNVLIGGFIIYVNNISIRDAKLEEASF